MLAGRFSKLHEVLPHDKSTLLQHRFLHCSTVYCLYDFQLDPFLPSSSCSVYKVMDMAPLGRVLVEVVEPHAVEHHSSLTGAEDALVSARWAVSKAGENHAFLVTLPDTKRSYTFVTKRWVRG